MSENNKVYAVSIEDSPNGYFAIHARCLKAVDVNTEIVYELPASNLHCDWSHCPF